MQTPTRDEVRPATAMGEPLPADSEPQTQTEEEQPSEEPVVNLEHDAAQKILVSLMFPSVMSALVFSMTKIALPEIRATFQISEDMTAWIATAFTLPYMIMMPLYGRLGDGLDRRRLILICISIFAVGTTLTLIAPSLIWLVAGRVIQGLGVAGMTPLAMAIISNIFPDDENGKALGTWSTVGPTVGFIAPVVAGFLIDQWGWRAAFAPPLLMALVAFPVVFKKIPGNLSPNKPDFLKHFDWTGAALLAASMTAFLCYLSSRPITGVEPLQDWRLLGAGVALLGTFIWWERRREDPFVDLSIFSHKSFNLASFAGGMRMTILAGLGFLIPLYLVDIHEFSAAYIGAVIMISSGTKAMIVRYGGKIADSVGSRWPCVGGLAVQVSVMVIFFFLPATIPVWIVALVLAGHGLGSGLVLAALHQASMEEIPETKKGMAAGLYNMSRFGGTMTGAAMGGVLLHLLLNQGFETIAAYQYSFLFFAGTGALGLMASFGLPHCREEEGE